jgi:hypothetical protein
MARVAWGRGYVPRNQGGFGIGQFIQSMLGGGPVPYARAARRGTDARFHPCRPACVHFPRYRHLFGLNFA